MKYNVLISIKPKYVMEILAGKKKFEYRKSIFKKEVEKVFIYSTSPEKKIIGYFTFTEYFKGTPEEIWESTKQFSGIDCESYFKYFDNKKYAYAIKIGKIHVFAPPIDPNIIIPNFVPPQSYMYLKGDILT